MMQHTINFFIFIPRFFVISAPSVSKKTQKIHRTGNALVQYKASTMIFQVLSCSFVLLLSKRSSRSKLSLQLQRES